MAGAALALGLALPQAAQASSDTQAWETLNLNLDLGNGWRASNETVLRAGNVRGFYEIEDNAMIGYRLKKLPITVWLGYTHDPQYFHGNFTVMEDRFRQQISFDKLGKIGPVAFSGRLRLEERWRPGISATGWRLRPYVKASLPIHGKTALVVSNESFVPLNHMAFQRITGLDRMRTFVGISTPLAKRFTLEAGYLDQHAFVRNGEDNDDNVLSVAISANF